MVINCYILMVALIILSGVSTGLSLFSIWVSTTHCLPGGSIGKK